MVLDDDDFIVNELAKPAKKKRDTITGLTQEADALTLQVDSMKVGLEDDTLKEVVKQAIRDAIIVCAKKRAEVHSRIEKLRAKGKKTKKGKEKDISDILSGRFCPLNFI
jgi:hypothetical protein